MKTIVASLVVLLNFALLNAALGADAPATQPLTDGQRMQLWWDDLGKPDPLGLRAMLNFIDKPNESVAFIKERLKPLTISEDDLKKLIADLGSDDEAVWKAALEKLEYFDPRLTIDLPTLMNTINDQPSRNRMIEMFSGRSVDSLAGKNVTLQPTGHDDYQFQIRTAQSVQCWPAEAKVSELNVGWTTKKSWTRAVRAIVVLERIATPDAVAVLRDMATGNPDAMPTKTAQEALDRIESADK
jgi:hypothetical protein